MYITIAARDYIRSSGGIACLHYLAYLLHKLGHRVDVMGAKLNPEYGDYAAPNSTCDLFIVPEINPPTYPGNVVRWVMFFPGQNGGPMEYPEHETVVSFHPTYTAAARCAAGGRNVYELFLPVCDLPGITDDIQRTDRFLAWYGKGPRAISPEALDAVEITRSWPATRKALVHTLMSAQRLYSFDQYTILNSEAQLCGCAVYVWTGERFMPFDDPTRHQLLDTSDHLSCVKNFLACVL